MQTVGGATPLMYACQQCRENEVSDILTKQPYSAKDRDRTLKTPLHYCAENPNTSCAEAVLKVAPELANAQDENGYCGLHLAVIAGNKPLIKLLIAEGADVNIYDYEGHSAVHWAIVSGEKEALEMIIRAGANPSTPDIHGGYPLHYAVQMCGSVCDYVRSPDDTVRIVETLLNFGADVNVKDKDGRQPILWAASAGSPDAVVHLVSGGACVEAADKDGLTALHCAASRGHTATLETLIALCGAHVDVIDGNGCSALFYSVTLGHADATELLLALGAEPNRQDRKGRTPAHCGAAKGQLETLRILQKGGGNLWLRNVKGDIPLHEAVASGRKDLVLWLLSQNLEAINISNNDGRSPLHIAAMYNNTEMVKVLLDSKSLVNPVMRTSKGVLMTPLNVALCRGHRSCGKYLQLHGGVPFSKVSQAEPFAACAVRISPSEDVKEKSAEASVEYLTPSPSKTSRDRTSTDVQVVETDGTDKKKVYRRRKKKKSSFNVETKVSDSDDSDHDLTMRMRANRRNEKNDDEEEDEAKKVRSKPREKSRSEKITKFSDAALNRKTEKEPQVQRKEERAEEKVVVKKVAKTKSEAKPLQRHKSFGEHKNVNNLSPEDFPPLMQSVGHLDGVTLEPEIYVGKAAPEKEDRESGGRQEVEGMDSERGEGARRDGGQGEGNREAATISNGSPPSEENKLAAASNDDEKEGSTGNQEEEGRKGNEEEEGRKGNEEEEEGRKGNEEEEEGKKGNQEEEGRKRNPEEEKNGVGSKEETHAEEDQNRLKVSGRKKSNGGNRKEDKSNKASASKSSNDEGSTRRSEKSLQSPASKSSSDGGSFKKEGKSSKSGHKSPHEGGSEERKANSSKSVKSGGRSHEKSSALKDELDKGSESKEVSPEEREKRKSCEDVTRLEDNEKAPPPPETNTATGELPIEERSPEMTEAVEEVRKPENVLATKATEDEARTKPEGGKPEPVDSSAEVRVSERNGQSQEEGDVSVATENFQESSDARVKREVTQVKTETSQNVVSEEKQQTSGEVAAAAIGLPQRETSETIVSSRNDFLSEGDGDGSRVLTSARENTFEEEAKEIKNTQVPLVEEKSAEAVENQAERATRVERKVKTPPDDGAAPPPPNEEPRSEGVPAGRKSSGKTDTVNPGAVDRNLRPEMHDGSPGEQRQARTPRVSRLCRRHGESKDDFHQISVNQLVQSTIRKYHMERGIFYQLLELKRLQIRAGRANEQVLVKRLADEYERSRPFMGMKHFSGLYKFKEFEKFLYDQLKALNARRSFIIPEMKSYDDIDALSGFLKKSRFKIISDLQQPDAFCTCITQRCHHSACAYTSVPCSAYITNMRRHKHNKPKRECFFPRIEPTTVSKAEKPKLAERPATLELIQGNEKHVITLPQTYPDKNKRYYITFTIKGAPAFKEEGFFEDSKDFFKHRHAKSV